MTTWAELGVSDPAPGDVWLMIRWSQKCGQIAEKSRAATNQLAAIDVDGWVGAGAARYTEVLATTLPELLAITSAHEQAQSAMKAYAEALGRFQDHSANLLASYIAARQRAQDAAAENLRRCVEQQSCATEQSVAKMLLIKARENAAGDAGLGVARWSQRLTELKGRQVYLKGAIDTAASQEVAANNEMAKIRGEVATLFHTREEAAKSAAQVIAAAVGAKLKSRNLWVRAGQDAWESGATVLQSQEFDRFLDFLDTVQGWASLVALGVSFVPGLGPVAHGASAALALLVLAGRTAQALNGKETWHEVRMGALSAFTSLVLPKGLQLATKPAALAKAERAAKAIQKGPIPQRIVYQASSRLGLGYLKQVVPSSKPGSWQATAGKALGKLPGAKLVEKGIQVAPAVDKMKIPVDQAKRLYALKFTLDSFDQYQDVRKYQEISQELHGFVSETFKDGREQ